MSDSTPPPVSITRDGQSGGTFAAPRDPVESMIYQLLTADPSKSDRAIAGEAGTDHKRVARVRKKLIASGTIAAAKQRKGRDGRVRQRPMPKLATACPLSDVAPEPPPDLTTGVAADILNGSWADALHGAELYLHHQLQPLRRLRRVPASERGLAAVAPVVSVLTEVAAALSELGRRADAAGTTD